MADRPQIAARVIGFARPDCKFCFGRGRIGWDAKYKDKAHVIPCRCCEWFDLEVIQESWKRDQEKLAKAVEEAPVVK
jgi:hypothetical protein